MMLTYREKLQALVTLTHEGALKSWETRKRAEKPTATAKRESVTGLAARLQKGRKTLGAAAEAALSLYTQTMRDGDRPLNTREKQLLTSAMTTFPPATVWRGAAVTEAALAKMQPGKTFTLKGFVSTTIDPKVGQEFADNADAAAAFNRQLGHQTGAQGRGVLFEVEATKGFYVGELSHSPNEKELLLPYGQRFEVTKRSMRGDREVIHVRQV